MKTLTVERLFSDPPLTGALPNSVKFSPAGDALAFLRVADDDRDRQDLWRFDLNSKDISCWLDARRLIDPDATMTDAEKAERERKRQFARGITSYDFAPDGSYLMIPVEGTGYLLQTSSDNLQAFTPDDTRQTDFTISPKGNYISYVRNGDLFYYDLKAQQEIRITSDGGGLISNGIADFIAQEEMHRFEGHWWSADESAIAFTRVDESPINASQRYEIDADEFNVVEQRYPYAGAQNASVELKVFRLHEQTTADVAWRDADDDYLARVNWAQNELAIQRQTRNQQTMSLDFVDPMEDTRRRMLTETSPTWLNLHDNFRSLDAERFLWTSERDGHAHLYLYSNGEPHQLTSGDAAVNRIMHVGKDEVLLSGWFNAPTEQHLYRLPLDGGTPEAITSRAGWHDVTVDKAGRYIADRMTSLDNPGALDLIDLESAATTSLVSTQSARNPYDEFAAAHCPALLGEIEAEDGQTLHYRLTRPHDTDTPVPLVVHVYGGPGVQRVKNEWQPLTVQLFAQHGFGVLELDNRGSSNRGRSFEAPIFKQMGVAEVADQIAGAEFAASLDWVDADRIGVFGHSYGGYMTLMCLAKAPGIFKAGVSVAPVTDWALYDTHYTERYLSTPQENSAGYSSSSVFPYLSALQGKLLVIHGMADDNVLFTNATKLFKALQQQNFPFEMMTYPGAKHALQERDVSIHRYSLILDFFQRNLAAK